MSLGKSPRDPKRFKDSKTPSLNRFESLGHRLRNHPAWPLVFYNDFPARRATVLLRETPAAGRK
jgi:hypothetical protein